MQDPAGFSQILCSAAMHMSLLRGESPARCVEAINFSIPAIQSVNRRLQDPILGVSDGVINTILAFVCHAGPSFSYIKTACNFKNSISGAVSFSRELRSRFPKQA